MVLDTNRAGSLKRDAHVTAAQELAKRTQERLKLEARLGRLEVELAALQEEASFLENRTRELECSLEAAKAAEREALAAKNAVEVKMKAAKAALESATAAVRNAEKDLCCAEMSVRAAEEELSNQQEILDLLNKERADESKHKLEAVREVKSLEAKMAKAQTILRILSIMQGVAAVAAGAIAASVAGGIVVRSAFGGSAAAVLGVAAVGVVVSAVVLATLTALVRMYRQQLDTMKLSLELLSKEAHQTDTILQLLIAKVAATERERDQAIATKELRNHTVDTWRPRLDSMRQDRVLANERALVSDDIYETIVSNCSRAAATVYVQALDLNAAAASLQKIREKISALENDINNITGDLLVAAYNAEQDLRQDRQQK